LACRYWAGRVALRENRARTHRLAGPRAKTLGLDVPDKLLALADEVIE
jgi:hypothetical protein